MKVVLLQRWLGCMTCENTEPGELSAGRLATKLVYGPLNRNGSPFAELAAKHLFYNHYLKAIAPFGWREQHTIVFDHLVAPTAFYISREEFEDWWREAGARDVTIGRSRGHRPPEAHAAPARPRTRASPLRGVAAPRRSA